MDMPKEEKRLFYGVNDRPPFIVMVLAGLQNVLTLFGATTLVPLIFGPAMGMTTAQIGFFVSSVYLAMGIATLIQISPLGSRLPIVQGSSFSFIPPVMTIIGMYKAGGPAVCMQAISGALISGGIVEAFLGYSKLIGKLKRFITPIVIGPTIMAIGFSLAKVAVEFNAAKSWPVSLLVVILIFVFSLIVKSRYLKIFSVLCSVFIVYILCLLASLMGIIPQGHPAFIDLSAVYKASWFRFTGVFPWGKPVFSGVVFGAILAAYFASIVESIGDYHSVSFVAGLDDPDENVISKGIGAEGIGCIISGCLGGVGTTSYTENIGLIGITKVASRWVVGTGAIILILISFIGKLGALIATVPSPIIGGAYIALFGIIGALGIQVLMRADMGSQRNVMIVGFSFLMALGLPGWVESVKDSFFAFGVFGQVVWAILKTPMAVAGLCAAFWDNILPATPEERGIKRE